MTQPTTTILVVDDDPVYRDFLAELVGRNGASAATVRSGREALAALQVGGYDGVIADILMPDFDGLELIRELRAAGNTVPILTMTGSSVSPSDPFLKAAKAFGADIVACKWGADTGAAVRELLDRARGGTA